jgi:hypothetical protein
MGAVESLIILLVTGHIRHVRCVGRFEIDWEKNSGFVDRGPLVQPGDLTKALRQTCAALEA